MDSLFRKSFLFCLENHQPEGLAFQAAMKNFIEGEFGSALDKIHFLIKLSEKNKFNNSLQAKLHLLKGQLQSEYCLYADAMIALTTAIEKNPALKEAYFERASAYFELGQFDQALADYLIQRDPFLIYDQSQFAKSFA